LQDKCYNWLKSRQKCNNPDINKETWNKADLSKGKDRIICNIEEAMKYKAKYQKTQEDNF
jgi:riboflavin synthase alpha subunit